MRTFADLYAGAGLFSHGFRSAGFEPSLALELSKEAAASYRRNVADVRGGRLRVGGSVARPRRRPDRRSAVPGVQHARSARPARRPKRPVPGRPTLGRRGGAPRRRHRERPALRPLRPLAGPLARASRPRLRGRGLGPRRGGLRRPPDPAPRVHRGLGHRPDRAPGGWWPAGGVPRRADRPLDRRGGPDALLADGRGRRQGADTARARAGRQAGRAPPRPRPVPPVVGAHRVPGDRRLGPDGPGRPR